MAQEVLRFEVVNEDVVVDLRPDNTVFQLMKIICNEWLDDARGGDGGVHDHMWKIVTPVSKHIGPFRSSGTSLFEDGDEAQRGYEEEEHASTKLQDLSFQPGMILRVQYDFGMTTNFLIALKSMKQVSEQDAAACPRKAESAAAAAVSALYSPPEGTPNLNDLFPHANKLLFQSCAQWIILFQNSEQCSLAVEAGPSAMGDMVYAPNKFGSLTETLIVLNKAAKEQHCSWDREDAFSRFVFPLKMTQSDEEKYREFKRDHDEFERVCEEKGINKAPMSITEMANAGLSQDYIYRLCGPKQVVVRVTQEDLATGVDLDKAFPKTAAAHNAPYHWISYRRGKMMICKGKDSGERGIPTRDGILAQTHQEIQSLHELFCAAESLWASVL